MKIIRRIEDINIDKPTVITVGSFDGIHQGHQQILTELKKQSLDCNCLEMLITFHPHPKVVLTTRSDIQIELLTPLDEKIRILENLQLSTVLIIPFDKEFSRMKYQNFVKDILVNQLKVKKMVIGYDHAFGRNREGHPQQLKEMGKKYDFTVTVMKPFLIDGEVVNSTRIRQLLKDGEVKKTQKLLGRKYAITGIVERGNNRGKSLGFPTANLRCTNSHKLIPKRGVYAVDVSFQNKIYKGMMNIGYRPTFNFDPLTLEVHIFNFTGSIYDEQLEIQFKKFIRDEKKFQNITQLKNQILKDREICYKL